MHLDDDLTSRYAMGQTDSAESLVVVNHLAECNPCRELIAELARSMVTDDEGGSDPLCGLTIGRYVLAERLGNGVHGVVYRAHDPVLDRSVALKLLRNLDKGPQREQLLAAARAMARIDHRNVLPIYDAGEDRDEVFVAFAIAERGDLRTFLESKPDKKELLIALADLADGLAAIHAAGLIHRDIKPDNVLVDKEARLLLADMGHAASTSTSPTVTTPAYLPPEAGKNAVVGKKGDQYALAITICEALCGTRPKSVDEATMVLRRAEVPSYAIRALSRALSPKPADRFSEVSQFAAALRPSSRRVPILVAALIGISIVVAALFFFLRTSPTPSHLCMQGVAAVSARWNTMEPRLAKRFVGDTSAWSRARVHLNQHFSEMNELRTTMCEAVKHDEPGSFAKLACLGQRAEEAEGVLSALAEISVDTLSQGGVAALLTPVSSCERGTPFIEPPIPSGMIVESLRIRTEIAEGRALATLGEYERAARIAQDALESANALDAKSALAQAHLLLAAIAQKQGHRGEALVAFQKAAEAGEASGNDKVRANALMGQFLTTADADTGKAIVRRAEVLVSRTEDPELRANFLSRRAIYRLRNGRMNEGLEDLEEARDLVRRLLGEKSTHLLSIEENMTAAYHLMGRAQDGERLARQLLARERSLYGNGHPKVARRLGSLAIAVGKEEGTLMLKEALGIFRNLFGDANPDTILALTNLCTNESAAGAGLVSPYCMEAVSATAKLYGEQSPKLAWPLTALGLAYLNVDRFADAEVAFEKGLQLAADPPSFPNELADLRYYLAAVLAKQKKQPKRALSLAKQARAVWVDSPTRQQNIAGVDELIGELQNEPL